MIIINFFENSTITKHCSQITFLKNILPKIIAIMTFKNTMLIEKICKSNNKFLFTALRIGSRIRSRLRSVEVSNDFVQLQNL